MSKLQAVTLGKSFKTRRVVDDVSLEVSSGEIVGLLGPNGAGKTTSFYMIVGLIACGQGKILLDENDLTRKAMHVRAQHGISYLPQEPSIFRKLTVADNIMAILQLCKGLTRKQRQQKLQQLLEEFNLEHVSGQLGMSLSGGERRRVEIARALAINPTFILLDEPFAGVDPISVLDLKKIIKHLSSKGIGILMTDHNVRETLDICQRAYIVNQGKIIASGNAETILGNELVREVYLGEEFNL